MGAEGKCGRPTEWTKTSFPARTLGVLVDLTIFTILIKNSKLFRNRPENRRFPRKSCHFMAQKRKMNKANNFQMFDFLMGDQQICQKYHRFRKKWMPDCSKCDKNVIKRIFRDFQKMTLKSQQGCAIGSKKWIEMSQPKTSNRQILTWERDGWTAGRERKAL